MTLLDKYYSIHNCVNCGFDLKTKRINTINISTEASCHNCKSYKIYYLKGKDKIEVTFAKIELGKYAQAIIGQLVTKFLFYGDDGFPNEELVVDAVMQINRDNFNQQLDRARKLKAFE